MLVKILRTENKYLIRQEMLSFLYYVSGVLTEISENRCKMDVSGFVAPEEL